MSFLHVGIADIYKTIHILRNHKTAKAGVREHMHASGSVGIRLILWYTVAHGARVRSSGEVSCKIFGKDLSVVAMTI